MNRWRNLLCLAAVALLVGAAAQALAAPAQSSHLDDRASVSAGKALMPLWLRGRLFYDIWNNNRWDLGTDKPLPNKALEVGRLVGGNFVSLGSATTDASGIFDFRFTAGAGGNFSIYDVASKKVVHTFAWPDGASSAGQNVPIDPPTTSTKTKTTSRTTTKRTTTKAQTQTKTSSKTKTTTRSKTSTTSKTKPPITTTCVQTPVYDGTAFPWLVWQDKTTGSTWNDGEIIDLDVDSSGNIYFCGKVGSSIDFGRFNVTAYNADRGIVGKLASNGTVAWFQALSQTAGPTGAESKIRACKLTPDGTKLVVSGYSAEATITLGSRTVTKVGDEDSFIAQLDPATGTVSSLIGVGKSGESGYGLQRLAKGTTGTVMYQFVQTSNGASFSDSGTLSCSTTETRCCVAIKYTGTTRSWVQTVENSFCFVGDIVASTDGTLVFAGAQDSGLYVLDAGNGSVLATTYVSSMREITALAVIGSDLYMIGPATGNASVDSVKIVGPTGVSRYTALVKFTISGGGTTITGVKGTWIGSNEYSGDPYFLSKGYDISGTANRLLVGLMLRGTTLQSGGGYAKKFGSIPANQNYQYGFAAVALVDISTFNITYSNAIGGDDWTPYKEYAYPNAGYMHPTTGAVYLGGRVGMLHDKDCLWDFTNETYADNIADTQIWPYLAKFTKTMDWPATRG